MKKITTLLSGVMLACAATGNAQTVLQEDFSSTTGTALPAGWTQVKAAASNGWFTTTGKYDILASAGFSITAGNGRYVAIDDQNNDVDNNSTGLVTPALDFTGIAHPWVTFNAFYFAAKYTNGTKAEKAWVSASIDNGTTWTKLTDLPAGASWTNMVAADLTPYANNNNVKIGFFFSDDNGGKMIGYGIDDIKVYAPAAAEMALTSITPQANTAKAYGVASATMPVGGTVYNYGALPITTFKVHYQLGTNPEVVDVITGVSIAPFTTGSFTCPTALAMPATLAQYPLKMWVELTGDANAINDSSKANATSVQFLPAKKIFVEEGTGTWCGYCPRGAVYMDSIGHTYPSNFTLAAVHNRDPMTVTEYDQFMGPKIGGYPNVLVDRKLVTDPSRLFDVYTEQKDNFGFANVTMTDMAAESFNLSVKVSVKPSLDLTGDHRLALILTENKVHGEESEWNQRNYYYGNAGSLGVLKGAGHDWNTEGVPTSPAGSGSWVEGKYLYYDFVARAIVPGPNGAAGSLPTTMTAGNTYDYTFNTTTPPPFNRANMKVVALLIRASDGAVLNSNDMVMPLGISNVAAGVKHMSVYPNPATDATHVVFNLDESAKVKVLVMDAVGRVVNTVAEQQYNAGEQNITISTANLSAGIYTIKLSTEKGMLTQQLSVVK